MKSIANVACLLLMLPMMPISVRAQSNPRPNVIIILTDDQGYGDLGIHGNPHAVTPQIDKLARESIRFTNFYVSPVCAPTRASLMTGRYSLRTGIRDTYNGGAMMAGSEVTLAEMLKQAHYKTGIFGKWHLGDNYPMRPMDQGFDESVIHLAGGMGQVGDFTTWFRGDSSYFDPVLWHNGKPQSYPGYCSDIFAEEAIRFIEKNHQSPFFCYLAFNAPHTPLQVPEKYYRAFRDIDPAAGLNKGAGASVSMSDNDREDARRVYAMVSNIDDNIGRLLRKLEALNIAKNTIVIFMTDNGPQQARYNAGMRGLKASVYRGGIRVPFFLRYPAAFESSKDIHTTGAHIDVLPTIAQLCQVKIPEDRIIDGKSLLPLLTGNTADFENRALFFYWTRRLPQRYNNMALQKGHYRLVGHTGYNGKPEDFALYDLASDSSEQNNIVKSNTALAGTMKAALDSTYEALVKSENLINTPRIVIGHPQENPVFLNRNDANGQPGIWAQPDVYGYWKVKILAGRYNIRFKFLQSIQSPGQMCLETNTRFTQMNHETTGTDVIEMRDVYLPAMDCDFTPYYQTGSKRLFPFWVALDKTD